MMIRFLDDAAERFWPAVALAIAGSALAVPTAALIGFGILSLQG